MKNKNIFFILFIFFLYGCSPTNFIIEVKGTGDGEIIVEHNLDQNIFSKLQNLDSGARVFKESFSKRDFLFVLYYKFDIGINYSATLPTDFPLEISLLMPGQIIKTNAKKIRNNKLFWHFLPGDKFEISAESRQIRWWLIIILSLVLLNIIYKMLKSSIKIAGKR